MFILFYSFLNLIISKQGANMYIVKTKTVYILPFAPRPEIHLQKISLSKSNIKLLVKLKICIQQRRGNTLLTPLSPT